LGIDLAIGLGGVVDDDVVGWTWIREFTCRARDATH